MTPQDFVYWLQGYFELSTGCGVSEEQVHIIRRHLHLVFQHIDAPDPDGKLQDIHDGKPQKPQKPQSGSNRPTLYRC